MVNLKLNQQQVQNFFVCLDVVLKTEGMNSLNMIVDLHNVLLQAVKQSQSPQAPPDSNNGAKIQDG